MKKLRYLYLLLFVVLGLFTACNSTTNNNNNTNGTGNTNNTGGNNNSGNTNFVDYVSQLKLEKSFENTTFVNDGIEEVTYYQAVDGDTVHVYSKANELMKLRFVSVDTPESTSSIEPWGKAASEFTKSKVKNTTSIVITSETGGAGAYDSYGRWLAFVWYLDAQTNEYRNLNLELVQESYSLSKVSADGLYHDEFTLAADQARKGGLKVWGEKDPNYCYDGPKEVSLMEIKKDLVKNGKDSQYLGQKVVFDATVARYTQSVGYTYYLVDTDLDTGETYGIQAYSISTGTGKLRKATARVRISGTITYYENGNTFQLADIIDRTLSKDNYNLKVLEESTTLTPFEIQAASDLDVTNKFMEYRFVSAKNLVVTRCSTTTNEDSSNNGAITIYCKLNGEEVVVRTTPLLYQGDKNYIVNQNNIISQDNFTNKTIDVVGIIECYYEKYQIKVVSMDDITIHQ